MVVVKNGSLASLALLLLSHSLTILGASITSQFGARAVPRVKESVHHPRGWTQGARAPPNHLLELRIALPQENFHVLEQHLYEVSDPDHSRYGQHLSKTEVEALVAPHPNSLGTVEEWLALHGLGSEDFERSPAQDWIIVRVPVSLAEEMLHTEYHVWVHEASGDRSVRTLTYSIPEFVFDHVDLIQPTTMFTRTRHHRTSLRWSTFSTQAAKAPASGTISLPNGIDVDASCNSTITIDCLQALYNAVGYKASNASNKIGITGYLDQYANENDLQLFYTDQRQDAIGSSFDFVSVNGGKNSQNASQAGAEANLDTQFAYGLTFPTPSTFWSTAGSPPFNADLHTTTNTNEPYTTWLDFILTQDDVPQTISTSYGDDEQTVPQSYAQRACNSFAQLGARGVSLLFSSGDGGVGDGNPNPATQVCKSNDGQNITRFIPTFPATCPYVTTVGGTINIPEVAVEFSSGGFSNYFSRPKYQEEAVQKYLSKLPSGTYEGLFNSTGRGFPDVSAQADRFRIFYQGQPGLIGGTSAAAPAFAGFISLLNDVRLNNGLSPLGFLNPFLYQRGVKGLNDITEGNNPGCGTLGFNASEGWDPVTGLGTPDFGKLKQLVL